MDGDDVTAGKPDPAKKAGEQGSGARSIGLLDQQGTLLPHEKQQRESKVRVIVRPGRTLHAEHPTETRYLGRHPDTGEQIYGLTPVAFGPGEEVDLPESEARRLRSIGHVSIVGDPEGPSPLVVGPSLRDDEALRTMRPRAADERGRGPR